jgi:hypothetical protein
VQPRESVWLIGIEPKPCRLEILTPEADGEVRQGPEKGANFGKASVMGVRQSSDGSNRISLIRFRVPSDIATVRRVLLRVHGHVDGPSGDAFDHLVYGMPGSDWDEKTLSAGQAPGICRTVSAVAKVDLATRPVGHLSFVPGEAACIAWLDVTSFVQEHPDAAVTFVLIKEKKYADDDFRAYTATFSTREDLQDERRPALELWR